MPFLEPFPLQSINLILIQQKDNQFAFDGFFSCTDYLNFGNQLKIQLPLLLLIKQIFLYHFYLFLFYNAMKSLQLIQVSLNTLLPLPLDFSFELQFLIYQNKTPDLLSSELLQSLIDKRIHMWNKSSLLKVQPPLRVPLYFLFESFLDHS